MNDAVSTGFYIEIDGNAQLRWSHWTRREAATAIAYVLDAAQHSIATTISLSINPNRMCAHCTVERCLVVVQRENDRIETKTEAEREKTSVRRSKLLFSETRRKKIDEKAKLKQNLFIASVQCTAEVLLLRSFGRWQCHHSDFQSHIRNKIAYKPGQARTMLRKYSNNIVDAPSHPEITQRTHRDHKKRMRIIKTLTSVVANVENYKSISIMIQSLFSVFILATHSLRLGSAINSFGETTAANTNYYTLTHTQTLGGVWALLVRAHANPSRAARHF